MNINSVPKDLQFSLSGSNRTINVNALEKQPNKLLQALLIIKKNASLHSGLSKAPYEGSINAFKNRLLEIHNSDNNNNSNTKLSPYHYCKLLLNFPDLIKTEEDTDKLVTQILDFFQKIHANPEDLKNLKRGEKLIEFFRESLKRDKRLDDLLARSEITIPSEENEPFKLTNIYRWARIPTFRKWLFGQFQPPKSGGESFSLKFLQILDQFLLTNALPNDLDADTLNGLYSLANYYLLFDDLINPCADSLIDKLTDKNNRTLTKKFIVFFDSVLKDPIPNKILFNKCLEYLKSLNIYIDSNQSGFAFQLCSKLTQNKKDFLNEFLPKMQFKKVVIAPKAAKELLKTNIIFPTTTSLYLDNFREQLLYEEFNTLGKHFPQVRILEVDIPPAFFASRPYSNWNNIKMLFCFKEYDLKKDGEKTRKMLSDSFPNLSTQLVAIKITTVIQSQNIIQKLYPNFNINFSNMVFSDDEIAKFSNFVSRNHVFLKQPDTIGFRQVQIPFCKHPHINFNGCKNITGEWILSLNDDQRKSINYLDIRGCEKITPETIERIKEILPNCNEFYHDELPSKKRALEASEENPSPYKKPNSNGKDEIID